MDSRPYQYRYRPYDYRENQIREESRKRQNRRQLKFSPEEFLLIEKKIYDCGLSNFSEYKTKESRFVLMMKK